jgi:hypothetical protein
MRIRLLLFAALPFALLSPALCGGCAATGHAGAADALAPTAGQTPASVKTHPVEAFPEEQPTALGRWTATLGHHHGLMLGMRLTEVWLWPEPFAEMRPTILRQRYHDAFTQAPKWDGRAPWFQWDGDRWFINVVGHAALGSELYLKARRCKFQPLAAMALTAASSAVWEYGYEASGVRPSALDLVYTPVSGVVIGETRYWLIQQARTLTPGWRRFVTVVLDPFGEAERGLGFPC